MPSFLAPCLQSFVIVSDPAVAKQILFKNAKNYSKVSAHTGQTSKQLPSLGDWFFGHVLVSSSCQPFPAHQQHGSSISIYQVA
jgi:hypothetical protein